MLVLHDDAITQNVFASFPSYVGAPGPSSCVTSKAFPSCLAVFLQANLVPPSTPCSFQSSNPSLPTGGGTSRHRHWCGTGGTQCRAALAVVPHCG